MRPRVSSNDFEQCNHMTFDVNYGLQVHSWKFAISQSGVFLTIKAVHSVDHAKSNGDLKLALSCGLLQQLVYCFFTKKEKTNHKSFIKVVCEVKIASRLEQKDRWIDG